MENGKKPYERGRLEIISFESRDVICTSSDEMYGTKTPDGGWV